MGDADAGDMVDVDALLRPWEDLLLDPNLSPPLRSFKKGADSVMFGDNETDAAAVGDVTSTSAVSSWLMFLQGEQVIGIGIGTLR